MRANNKLTAVKVAKLTKPGVYSDGDGLNLQISKYHTKSWILRYSLNHRPRYMGLGSVRTFTLAEARERARAARQLIADGIDPIEQRRTKRTSVRVEDGKRISFNQCAAAYIKAHSPSWKSQRHRDQWQDSLANLVAPIIGELPVDAIDTGLVLRVLEPIWTEKPETASRVRGRVELVLSWAAARGFRSGPNPAQWRGHLDKLLPKLSKIKKVTHHAALPYSELPAVLERLRAIEGVSALALEFAVLTAARTGEVRGAKWSEVDLAGKVWVIPASRMKAGREHRVPLSNRALEILASVPREVGNEHIFIGGRQGGGLSESALMRILSAVAADCTTHGMRSTFADWAGETTGHARETIEGALAHVVGDATERAYRRGDALAKRAALMEGWSRYCTSPPAATGSVTALRRVS